VTDHISEFSGTLLGFDDYVSMCLRAPLSVAILINLDMVLEDVTEFDYNGSQTKLPKILLNGNNICMVSDRKI
jgi:U6 snRNA-associated Sm-like protein LSm5